MLCLTINGVTQNIRDWAKELNVTTTSLRAWNRLGVLDEKASVLFKGESVRGYRIEYEGVKYTAEGLAEVLECSVYTVTKYFRENRKDELIKTCLLRKRLRSLTGLSTINELCKFHNISSNKIKYFVETCETREEFDKCVLEFKTKNKSTLLDKHGSNLTKKQLVVLKDYYKNEIEIEMHIKAGKSLEYILLFGNWFLYKDIEGLICRPKYEASIKNVLLRSILMPGDKIIDKIYSTLGKSNLLNINEGKLLHEVKECLGSACVSDYAEYIPCGYVSLGQYGVFSKSDLYGKIAFGKTKINTELSSKNYEYIYNLYKGNMLPEYNAKYHGMVLSLKELIELTKLPSSFIHKSYKEGKFCDDADWLDDITLTAGGRAINKEKALVQAYGKTFNVYELSTKYDTQTSRVVNILTDSEITEEEAFHILENNLPLTYYKGGFVVDGKHLTRSEVATMFGVNVSTVQYLISKYETKEQVIEVLLNEREKILKSTAICKGMSIVICGHTFPSMSAVDTFIGRKDSSSTHGAIQDNRLDNLIISYHIEERLLFKENSPYAIWFADGVWVYKCPRCGRKLLLSTQELITYRHDDKLCPLYEIE